jgi:hypothetical protein
MKKILSIAIVSSILLSGCAGLNRLPNKFDNVEYRDLVELNVLSKWSTTCNQAELDRMSYLGNILETYSAGTLNNDVSEIYKEISSITAELKTRENPSEVYCKLKRNTITESTNKAIEVFGGRLK